MGHADHGIHVNSHDLLVLLFSGVDEVCQHRVGLAHINYKCIRVNTDGNITFRVHTQYPNVQATEEGLELAEGVRIILHETDQFRPFQWSAWLHTGG